MGFKDELNTGFSWRFQLEEDGTQKTYDKWVDNGSGVYVQTSTTVRNSKFELFGVSKKANDNITMMLGFIGWFRLYYQDFVPEVLDLLQKPTSLVHNMKSIIIGKMKKVVTKYISEINVTGVSMIYDYRDRKLFTITLDYGFNLEEEENFTVVRFIQI